MLDRDATWHQGLCLIFSHCNSLIFVVQGSRSRDRDRDSHREDSRSGLPSSLIRNYPTKKSPSLIEYTLHMLGNTSARA